MGETESRRKRVRDFFTVGSCSFADGLALGRERSGGRSASEWPDCSGSKAGPVDFLPLGLPALREGHEALRLRIYATRSVAHWTRVARLTANESAERHHYGRAGGSAE